MEQKIGIAKGGFFLYFHFYIYILDYSLGLGLGKPPLRSVLLK